MPFNAIPPAIPINDCSAPPTLINRYGKASLKLTIDPAGDKSATNTQILSSTLPI
jgi:hypothetical protein